MAGELGPVTAPTGKYVYAVIHRGSAATVRDVVAGAWDAFADADIADYDVQIDEIGTASGIYHDDAPNGLNLTTEWHIAKIYYRDDSSVAIGDTFLGDQLIGAVPSSEVLGGINTTAGTIKTLDALDTAQDSQHGTTQTAVGNVATTIGAAGAGLTEAGGTGDHLSAVPDTSGTTTLLSRLTATRAGYLDKLNVSGNVASQADVTAITQAQRVRIVVPGQIERPDSGSTDYRIWIYVYNEQHTAEDLDSNPTVSAENNAGTDRSSNLGTVTKPGGTTGQYYVDYTVADSHAIEAVVFKVDATEGAVTTQYSAATLIVDTTAVDFTSADRAKLDTLHDTRIPGVLTPSNIADQVLDEAMSGHTTAGTLGKAVADVLEDTSTTLPGLIGTAQNDLDLLTGADGAVLATTQPNYAPAKAGDEMDLVDAPNATAISAIQNGLSTFNAGSDTVTAGAVSDKTGYSLTTAYDVYHADIKVNVDAANSRDEYTITWFKNGVRVTSGITSPTLQVVKRSDGTDLIASTTPTQIGSTGSYKHDESSGLLTAGEDALAIVGATIDASSRTFATLVGRDSSA